MGCLLACCVCVNAAGAPNVPRFESPVDAALFLGELELGEPYRWGGDNPATGFDCSGLMVEMLKSTGVLPRQGDWTAQHLYDRFAAGRVTPPGTLRRGMLVFWKRGSKIGHVEMVWNVVNGHVLTIGASGGGPTTTTPERAVAQDARVKVRLLDPTWVAATDPFKE